VNVDSENKTDVLSAPPDRRAFRRAERLAMSRRDILDSAERVFGEYGIHEGSLRRIAADSGFSTAAIYQFFDGKENLLLETLARRGDDFVLALGTVTGEGLSPLQQLHRIIDVAVTFFEAHPAFLRLVRQINGRTAIVGSALAQYTGAVDGHFNQAMRLISRIVSDGQAAGELREGSPSAFAHLYSVLINEHVLLTTEADQQDGPERLTPDQFHGLIDGALASPPHFRGGVC
jgi:AcrR family transcriptional regulator